MGDSSQQPKETVLVTGFGPFGNHFVNSSWVGVKTLSEQGLNNDNVDLVVHEIPVQYELVKKMIPSLWEKYKPKLVVHVGVSGIAKEITLEQQAHNDGYDKMDVCGQIPCGKCCVENCTELCLKSGINMNLVCEHINNAKCGLDAVVSYDPGRYLCDFIFYTSLNVDRSRTAFIHVPPLDKPYNGEQLAHAIRLAVNAMLQQLS